MLRTGSLILVAVAWATVSLAQVGQPDPEQLGFDRGTRDGRVRGQDEGSELGRAQAQMEAWLRGFGRGVRSQPDSWVVQDAASAGETDGRRPGLAAGEMLGREDGAAASASAYAELRGRPEPRDPPAPPSPAIPSPPLHPSCAEPGEIRLYLAAGRSVSIEPEDAERERPPFSLEIPDREPPGMSEARALGANAGFEDPPLEAWARRYRDGWQHGWRDGFTSEREAMSRSNRQRWESDGEAAGREEAERRGACDAHRRAYARGFEAGHGEGHARGWRDGWNRSDADHRTRPVLRVESVRLADGNDDGVLEPGEDVALEATLANAALVAAGDGIATWEGALGLHERGAIGGGLDAQARRQFRVAAGSIPEDAALGTELAIEVRPVGGSPFAGRGAVGRPVVVERVDAYLDGRDGGLVAVVRPALASVATKATGPGLVVRTGDVAAELGLVGPGARPDVALEVEVPPSALADGASGEVELLSGRAAWMVLPWTATVAMPRAVELAASLEAGSAARAGAVAAVAKRLERELARAGDETKLYKKQGERSELALYARAVSGVEARADFEAAIDRPLRARADARGTPRRIRKAIREALGE